MFVDKAIKKKFRTFLVWYFYGRMFVDDVRINLRQNEVYIREGWCWITVYENKVIRHLFVDEKNLRNREGNEGRLPHSLPFPIFPFFQNFPELELIY